MPGTSKPIFSTWPPLEESALVSTKTTQQNTTIAVLLKTILKLFRCFSFRNSQILKRTTFILQARATLEYTFLTSQILLSKKTKCLKEKSLSDLKVSWLATLAPSLENATNLVTISTWESTNIKIFLFTGTTAKASTRISRQHAPWDIILMLVSKSEKLLIESSIQLTPVCLICMRLVFIRRRQELMRARLMLGCFQAEELSWWITAWFVKICMESATGLIKQLFRQSYTFLSENSKPVVMLWPTTTKCLKTPVTGCIPPSSRLDSEYGFSKETSTTQSPSPALWPGCTEWEKTTECQWSNSGESGGHQVYTSTKTKSLEWCGNWEDLLLLQSKVQDIWCPRINLLNLMCFSRASLTDKICLQILMPIDTSQTYQSYINKN